MSAVLAIFSVRATGAAAVKPHGMVFRRTLVQRGPGHWPATERGHFRMRTRNPCLVGIRARFRHSASPHRVLGASGLGEAGHSSRRHRGTQGRKTSLLLFPLPPSPFPPEASFPRREFRPAGGRGQGVPRRTPAGALLRSPAEGPDRPGGRMGGTGGRLGKARLPGVPGSSETSSEATWGRRLPALPPWHAGNAPERSLAL